MSLWTQTHTANSSKKAPENRPRNHARPKPQKKIRKSQQAKANKADKRKIQCVTHSRGLSPPTKTSDSVPYQKPTRSFPAMSGPPPAEVNRMLQFIGVDLLVRLNRQDCPRRHSRSPARRRTSPHRWRSRNLKRATLHLKAQPRRPPPTRTGLLRLYLALRHSPQLARKSGLVHRLHSLPSRNLPRQTRTPAGLPADDY